MPSHLVDLSGLWTRSVGGRAIDIVSVPGGFRPLGECVLERSFAMPWITGSEARFFLVTEGVLASASFALNGRTIGTAGPFCTYRFEIPQDAFTPTGNIIQAHVKDLNATFGTTPGRLFESGLIRPIWIERRPAAFLEDVHFRYDLAPDFSRASCLLTATVNGAAGGRLEARLLEVDTGREMARAAGSATEPLRFDVAWPRLWSPEQPALYRLEVVLAGAETDRWEEQVGFRRIEVGGRDFYLNGERLVLRGVCRHEFTAASGYSPSPEEVRHELALIRHSGFNFVRLVHSPQAPWVPRLAAEIGLFVSEEPGTCWHDLGDEAIAAPAVEALRRTVLRDRNVPSIFAWLIYNECLPHAGYAARIARMIRALDPGCLLSMADCSGKDDEIKAMVASGDLSFYGINLYSPWPKDYIKRMETFADRPLVFTEWGACSGNARTLRGLCDCWVIHSRADEPNRFAGCAYWTWADYEERSRPRPASEDGWTTEGLLDQQGNPRPDLQTLSLMCFAIAHQAPVRCPRIEVLAMAPRRAETWQPVPLPREVLAQRETEDYLAALRRERRRYEPWFLPMEPRPLVLPRFGRRLVDGIEFVCRDEAEDASPLLLGRGVNEVEIPIGYDVSAIAFLGHVALQGGYPASSGASWIHAYAEVPKALGDPAAEYVFLFADREEAMPLRHGLEILRANDICRWWLTAPRASHTRPALSAVIDPTYEVLRIDLWEHRFAKPGRLMAIRWRLLDPEAILALWAVSIAPA